MPAHNCKLNALWPYGQTALEKSMKKKTKSNSLTYSEAVGFISHVMKFSSGVGRTGCKSHYSCSLISAET